MKIAFVSLEILNAKFDFKGDTMKTCAGISCKVTTLLQRIESSFYRLSQKVL